MTIRNANQEQPREPGDLNFDPLKFGGEGEYRFEMQESELVNGRLSKNVNRVVPEFLGKIEAIIAGNLFIII